jgi:hypothetical protein
MSTKNYPWIFALSEGRGVSGRENVQRRGYWRVKRIKICCVFVRVDSIMKFTKP